MGFALTPGEAPLHFSRSKNVMHVVTLTNDVNDHAQWQQGDIVVFDRVKHIGVISDKRDADGFSYVLHNMNQRRRENDYLAFSRRMGVTGHYRWDASRVPKSVLRAWKG